MLISLFTGVKSQEGLAGSVSGSALQSANLSPDQNTLDIGHSIQGRRFRLILSISFSESLSHQSGKGQIGQMADIQIIISLSAYSYAAILGEFRSRTLIFNIWAQKRYFYYYYF